MSEAVSEMDNLPNGWIASSVGQLYKIVGGGTPSTRAAKYWNGDISWISSADIHGLYDIRPRRNITLEAIKNSAANLVPAGSIIVVTRVGLGKIARTSTPLCFSQDSQALIGNVSFVNPDYMLYYLSQAVQSFKHASRGTTISGVTKKQLSDLLLPVAPLNEQKRIVSKIESIFVQINGTRTRLEVASGMLNKLRSSVLKQAFEGKLVSQDPNDEPVEAILKRIRRASEKELVFERDNLPKGWIKTTIDNVCLIILGRSPPSSTYNQDKVGLPFFQGKADFGTFHPTIRNWCTNPETFAEKNDILISVRAPVGPTNISLEKCCIGRGLAAVRSLDGVIFSYVFYHLRFLENYIATKGTGTIFKAIRGAQLRSIALSIPSLNEQKRIVSKIESIFTRIDAVERYIESTLRLLDLLKSSTLKQAFEGKLVPQDLDDEPAKFLLQIMKQEKQLIKSQKSSHGRKNVR